MSKMTSSARDDRHSSSTACRIEIKGPAATTPWLWIERRIHGDPILVFYSHDRRAYNQWYQTPYVFRLCGVDDVTAPRRHLMCQGGSATIHGGERSHHQCPTESISWIYVTVCRSSCSNLISNGFIDSAPAQRLMSRNLRSNSVRTGKIRVRLLQKQTPFALPPNATRSCCLELVGLSCFQRSNAAVFPAAMGVFVLVPC